jgi:hypothetical protein
MLIATTYIARSEYDAGMDPLLTDGIESKDDLLEQFHSRLLPLLAHQITDLVRSLDLSDSQHLTSNPDLELMLKVTSELKQTLAQITAYANSLAIGPDQPDPRIEYPCHHLETARSFRLLEDVEQLRRHISVKFLLACLKLIDPAVSKDDDQETENVSEWRKQILDTAASTAALIDGLIERCNRSDLGILQEEWQEIAESLDILLIITTETKRTSTIDAARAIPITQITESSRTLIKLSRLFYNKLSDSSIHKLTFKLAADLDSCQLDYLLESTKTFSHTLQAQLLVSLHAINTRELEDFEADRIEPVARSVCGDFIRALDSLEYFLVPLAPQVDHHAAPIYSFDTYFAPLKDSFLTAITNLVNLCSLLG